MKLILGDIEKLERLKFLSRVVRKEIHHLEYSTN